MSTPHEQPAPAQPPAPPPAPPELPAPPQPPLPTAPPQLPPQPPSAPTAAFARRRWVRATARWTVAAALFAGSGLGVTKVITDRERTDVPGLATEEDGRWGYPELALPALPAGAPAPFSDGNPDGFHHADLRALLLPAPKEAEDVESADGGTEGGWVETADFLELFAEAERERLGDALDLLPLRHIAARGWEMPDGTMTGIHLVRFTTPAVADAFTLNELGTLGNRVELAAAAELLPDEEWPDEGGRLGSVRVAMKVQPPGDADGRTRVAFLRSGDTIGLIVQTHPDDVAEVPFHQTVILQAQLLG
jgi:hypothetical protein